MAPGGTSFEPGARLGPYELQEELGHGGMGAVYRARDTRLHRDVAVKVLRAGLGENADRLRRFEQEARTVAQLHHTNVLAIFDVGAEDGTPYLVMELLEGETLQSRLKRGPLRPHEALDTARQLARGLAAAHAREILHRDLKPANVFLTRDGLVKVLDFGLAKLMVEQPRMDDAEAPTRNLHTGSGVIMGTVGYLSPEQIRGQGADSRSDIFAFGCVLWEMCIGEAPFQGASDVEVMHAILKDEPRAERSHPIIPGGVDAILSHCLEKDPAFRFQSAQDLLFALEATTAATQGSDASTQTLLRPRSGPNSAAPPSPTARRGWRAAALLAAGVALGGALAALALWPRKVDIPEIRGITFSGLDDSPSASPDGRTIAFSSWRDGHPRIWLKQLDTGSEAALTGGSDTLPRFSRDGATLLFVRNEPEGSSLYRVPALGGEARKLVSNAVAGDFSPDGRNVAWIRWVHEGGVITSILGVATRSGAKPRPVARFSGVALTAPRWSPDGAQIAVTSGGTVGQTSAFRARIYLANPENGRTKEIVPPSSAGTLSSVAWISPQALLFCQSETVNQAAGSSGRVYRLDLPSGAMEAILATPSSLSLDLLSGGRLIFDARSPKENLREFPVAGGAPAWITKGNSTDRQPVFAPDGRWVLFTSNRGGNMDLWAVSRMDGAVRRLTDDPANDWDPAYSHDGKRILWSSDRSGHFEIWMADADGSGAVQISADGDDAENPTMTGDGEWVVYASFNPAKAGVWKMRPDGREATRLVEGAVNLPEASPDGRYALYQTTLGPGRFAVRVVRLADGVLEPTQIEVQASQRTISDLGRARWGRDGRSIHFIAQNAAGVNGIFVQDFEPGRDLGATRRPLLGFDPDLNTESFGLGPDGATLAVAGLDQTYTVMIATGVPGLKR